MRRSWVVAGVLILAAVPSVPVAAAGVSLVLERVNGAEGIGKWVRTGDTQRFRVRLNGMARGARVAVAASPVEALQEVSCLPASTPAASPVGTTPVTGAAPTGGATSDLGMAGTLTMRALAVVGRPATKGAPPPGTRMCALGKVSGERAVDVTLRTPAGAREVVLAAVARVRDVESGGLTTMSRTAAVRDGEVVTGETTTIPAPAPGAALSQAAPAHVPAHAHARPARTEAAPGRAQAVPLPAGAVPGRAQAAPVRTPAAPVRTPAAPVRTAAAPAHIAPGRAGAAQPHAGQSHAGQSHAAPVQAGAGRPQAAPARTQGALVRAGRATPRAQVGPHRRSPGPGAAGPSGVRGGLWTLPQVAPRRTQAASQRARAVPRRAHAAAAPVPVPGVGGGLVIPSAIPSVVPSAAAQGAATGGTLNAVPGTSTSAAPQTSGAVPQVTPGVPQVAEGQAQVPGAGAPLPVATGSSPGQAGAVDSFQAEGGGGKAPLPWGMAVSMRPVERVRWASPIDGPGALPMVVVGIGVLMAALSAVVTVQRGRNRRKVL
ncbi:hypothetical protein HCN51_10120 [Nonomuraea sp. FMUSA5-5]|uniref:Uncharacterized protein n=1 Tax=Nonomuraea composti TaxID=2720023 RepID=A0ABX1B029_9ACTN|nr:hypothetical protein [Nonomuraea sp. FMUSA5-5]NJP89797.1 hypothetical protein [Nonomuraea sp. FMUSA5-5]